MPGPSQAATHSELVCLAGLQAVQQLGCSICRPTAVCDLVVIRGTRL
jgi:hypothetical protein